MCAGLQQLQSKPRLFILFCDKYELQKAKQIQELCYWYTHRYSLSQSAVYWYKTHLQMREAAAWRQ